MNTTTEQPAAASSHAPLRSLLGAESPLSAFYRILRKAASWLSAGSRRSTALAPPLSVNCTGYVDRRTRELTMHGQRLDDRAIERKWRERVSAHPIERARLAKQNPTHRMSLEQFRRERPMMPGVVKGGALHRSLVTPSTLRRQAD
jgi:hypothetical protein